MSTLPWNRQVMRFLTRRSTVPYVFVLPSVLVLLIVTLYPFIYSIRLSLHKYNLLKPWLGQRWVGLQNYIDLVTDERFWNAVRVTAVFTVTTISAELVLGLALALLINRRFFGKSVVRTVLLAPMIMSPVVVGLMWRMLYNADAGMINYFLRLLGIGARAWLGESATALGAVIITDIWQWTPFMMLFALAGLESLPAEPFEAAKIDGAGSVQVFRYITLPLLRPVLFVALLVRVMDSLKTFGTVFIMTSGGPGKTTELINIYGYKTGFNYFHMGYAAAISMTVTLFVTITMLIAVRVAGRREALE